MMKLMAEAVALAKLIPPSLLSHPPFDSINPGKAGHVVKMSS